MDERKRSVLRAIVTDYVSTAEPVGSRTIARRYGLGVSPATIRNEMSDLEELGMISQPHTSAGRIPSERGYRFFVDSMMEETVVTDEEALQIRTGLVNRLQEMSQLLLATSKMLSQATHCASVVIAPQLSHSRFRRLQIVPLDSPSALLVLLTESGYSEHRMISIPNNLTVNALVRACEMISQRLQGRPMDQVRHLVERELEEEFGRQQAMIDAAMSVIHDALEPEHEERVYVGGTMNIVNQPEFRDVEKLQAVLSLLEQQNTLYDLMTGFSPSEQVKILIGEETQAQSLRDCSLITATYQIDGQIAGTIGILGPTRMDYSKNTSVVDFVRRTLNQLLTR